ncbi:MAG: hypothetical protein K0U98_06030 [Deltaproteobacteria bacterium]|nr:hypothetical protein [Deltaproteobacteria bacterium]
MSTGFEFFEGPTTESTDVPRITIRRGGLMVLTRAAVEMLGEGVGQVQIGYNPETRAIGLRAADNGARGSYRLREQRNSVSRLVDGKRFFAHHGLTVEKARSFGAQDFGDGVVGFVLEEERDGDGSDPAPAKAPAKAKSKTRKQ